MMPEMQVSEKQALQNENNDLHQRIREKDYRIKELEAQQEELDRFRNGFQGACYCCELVGMKNVELQQQLDAVRGVKRSLVAHARESGKVCGAGSSEVHAYCLAIQKLTQALEKDK